MTEETTREKLLLQMYDQMFNDINRHIMVVWQSIGVLVGSFAIFALAEREVVSIDVAASLIVLIAGWSLAHHLDASYWYNRNLAIIANIERQFLEQKDLKQIHYYFGSHRPHNRMITHLNIQVFLAFGIAFIVMFSHFYERVMLGFGLSIANLEPLRAMPYVVVVGLLYPLLRLRGNRNRSYKEFIKNSPGIKIDTTGVTFGEGHGFERGRGNDK